MNRILDTYEIQLRYVIRDKIQSETKLSPKQLWYVIWDKIQSETNSVQDKTQTKTKLRPRQIQSKTKFSREKILLEKNFTRKKNLFEKILGYFLRLNFVLNCILSWTEIVSDFQCAFLSCLGQISAYHH